MWDNGEWISHPFQTYNTPQTSLFNNIDSNISQTSIFKYMNNADSWNSWDYKAQEVPSFADDTASGFAQLNNLEYANSFNINNNTETSEFTASEVEPAYETSELNTIGIPETTSKTFNWDLIWNPARSFATEDQATIHDMAQASASIPEINPTSEMIEGVAEGASFGAGALEAGAALVSQALTGVESSILDNRVSNANYNAQQQYNNAMNTGHGIGYQNVAANNLMNAMTASSNYKAYYGIMTSLLGPFGGMVSLLTPMDTPTQQTSYMADTASGEQTDAQSADVVNTASA